MTDLAAVARSLRYNDTWWGTLAAEDIEALLRAVPALTWLLAEARWWAEREHDASPDGSVLPWQPEWDGSAWARDGEQAP